MHNIVLYFNIKLTKRDWYIYRIRGKTEQTLNPVFGNKHQKNHPNKRIGFDKVITNRCGKLGSM